jgi:hypothetical protein
MKREILESAKQTFGKERLGNLPAKLDDWISDKEGIVSFICGKEEGNILVLVTDNPDPYPDDAINYKLCRFFPIGNKWEVSIDYSGSTAEEMMDKLLKYC